jgi:hypothetical protein
MSFLLLQISGAFTSRGAEAGGLPAKKESVISGILPVHPTGLPKTLNYLSPLCIAPCAAY